MRSTSYEELQADFNKSLNQIKLLVSAANVNPKHLKSLEQLGDIGYFVNKLQMKLEIAATNKTDPNISDLVNNTSVELKLIDATVKLAHHSLNLLDDLCKTVD